MADIALRIMMSAVGGGVVSSIIADVAKSLGSGGLAGGLAMVGIAAAATAVTLGVTAVKAAGDFQQGMTTLVTGAGEASNAIGTVSSGILQMAVDTGTSTQQLTAGMFMVESAGYHLAKGGLDVLRVAAEGAKVGNADLGAVAFTLTGILHNYHLSASDAAGAMNALTVTVGSGKMHLQDLSTALGAVLPLAASLKVSFPQVAGAVAEMTNSNTSAQLAAQHLAFTLSALSAPNKAAVKSMAEVGLTAQQVKDTLAQKGLTGALQLVEDHVGKHFPAGSVASVEALKHILGGTVGWKTALALSGPNMKDYETNVKNIGDAMKNGKGSVQGWTDVQKDFNFKADQARQSLNVLGVTIGTALLPVVGNVVTWVTKVITAFTDWVVKNNVIQNTINAIGTALTNTGNFIHNTIVTIQNIAGAIGDWWNKADLIHKALDGLHDAVQRAKDIINGTIDVVKNIVDWFVKWHEPILTVSGAITLFFLPAIIKAGVEATIAGGKITVSFIQSMYNTGTQAVINGAKTTASFVSSMVKSGVEAVVNGAKVTASFVASMARAGVEAVVNGAKVTASFVSSLIKTGIEGWTAAGKLGLLIGQFIATGVQAVIAGAKMTAQFIASIVKAGVSAVITAGQFVASLIPAIIAFIAQSLVAAATAIPAMVAGLIAWAAGAWAAAAGMIAATWPILLIIALIALLVIGIFMLVTHWKQVVGWIGEQMNRLKGFVQPVLSAIGGFFSALGTKVHQIWDGIVAKWNGAVDFFKKIGKGIQDAFGGIGAFIQGVWDGIWGGIKGFINNIIGGINFLINGINNISGKIGIPAIPDIPKMAQGGVVPPGQVALAGETGQPELVFGGTHGATVVGVNQTAAMMRGGGGRTIGGGGGTTNIFYINLSTMARSQSEVAHLVDLFEQELANRFRTSTPSYASGNIF